MSVNGESLHKIHSECRKGEIYLAEKKSSVKLNKKHQGKEFNSYFHFIGKVSKNVKGIGDEAQEQPYFTEKPTKTGKQRRSMQFDIETAKYNTLKVEQNGMPMDLAYAYSQTHKKSTSVKWDDRFDKSKLPDDTYHLMETDWDKTKRFGDLLKDEMWVEVKGEYEFDTSTFDGTEYKIQKRMATQVNPILPYDANEKYRKNALVFGEDGVKIYKSLEKDNKGNALDDKVKWEQSYVADFDADNFKEQNYVSLQVGVDSVYQDEDKKDTKINGIFLTYGKERSTPKDVELTVYYKEAPEGKLALADAFAKLDHLDFVEVIGVDNNRPEFSEVEDVVEVDEDPFADVSDEDTVVKKNMAISGNRKGIEITSIVKGSYIKELLTEEEIKKDELVIEPSPFDNAEGSDSDPFSSDDDDPFK